MRLTQLLIAAASLLALATAVDARTRAECERDYKPQVGQAGKDVIWVPTPDALVERMLSTAKVTSKDFVVDLGAGDGKIAIAAARDFGATSLGIEYNPDMAKLAQCFAEAAGVAGRARIIRGDIFKEDFSKANVVTMYLLPELNLCVRHRLLAMAPGTRVTSHAFTMGEWQPDDTFEVEHRSGYLWIVPARVGGTWNFRGGNADFTVTLNQIFQKVGGEVAVDGRKQSLVGVSLNGDNLRFSFVDTGGVTRHFSGVVRGNTIIGPLQSPGITDATVTGTLEGAPATAPWAAIAPGCDRFYAK